MTINEAELQKIKQEMRGDNLNISLEQIHALLEYMESQRAEIATLTACLLEREQSLITAKRELNASYAATAAPIQSAKVALLVEARAVFDLMLEGCSLQSFGDYQNGDGETIGPRMDDLHAALRALAATPAQPIAPTTELSASSERGVDYIIGAVESYARYLQNGRDSFGAQVEAVNALARIRRMLEDDAAKLEAAQAAQPIAPAAAVSAPTDERAAFEASRTRGHHYDKNEFGFYVNSFVESDFQLWRAARAGSHTAGRAAFEQWANSGAHITLSHVFSFTMQQDGKRYHDGTTELCWRAYQAARAAAPVSGPSDGYVLAPHYRGYANLGAGQYILNHSAAGNPAEFVISIATEDEKAGRVVGDEMPNAPDAAIQPEVMAVRIGFANVAGLDAMEARLRHLRAEHFPSAAPVSGQGATPDSRFLHGGGPAADEPKVNSSKLYFWRMGWNAYRTALLDSRPRSEDSRADALSRALQVIYPAIERDDLRAIIEAALISNGYDEALASTPPKADNAN